MPRNNNQTLNDSVNFRCDHIEKKRFMDHCRLKLKRPYQDVLREIVEALPSGRVTIKPTETQKRAIKETYNVD